MRIYRKIITLVILILIISSISAGEKSRPPSDVEIFIDTTQGGPVTTLTIRCDIRAVFTNALLTLELMDGSGTLLEKTTLWESQCDSSFKREFIRSVSIEQGAKLWVRVLLGYRIKIGNIKCSDGANLFIYNHPTKGFLISYGSFQDIEKIETWKEAYAKGYKGLTIDQIIARDPELGKRLNTFTTEPWILGPSSSDPNASRTKFSPDYVDSSKYLPPKEPENKKRAIEGTSGDGQRHEPRYDTIDSLGAKMKKESRRHR